MMVVIFTLSSKTEKRFCNYGPMGGKKSDPLKTKQKEEKRKHLCAISFNDINFN